MKTLVSPIVAFALFWYYNRVRALNRSKLLVEKAILVLGLILLALDCKLMLWHNGNGSIAVPFSSSSARMVIYLAAISSVVDC